MLKVLINLSAIADFPSCVGYISISLSCNHDINDLLQNSLPFSNHILFGLQPDSSKIFRRALVIGIPFCFSKERPLHIYYKY